MPRPRHSRLVPTQLDVRRREALPLEVVGLHDRDHVARDLLLAAAFVPIATNERSLRETEKLRGASPRPPGSADWLPQWSRTRRCWRPVASESSGATARCAGRPLARGCSIGAVRSRRSSRRYRASRIRAARTCPASTCRSGRCTPWISRATGRWMPRGAASHAHRAIDQLPPIPRPRCDRRTPPDRITALDGLRGRRREQTPHAMTRPSSSVPRMVSSVGSTWLTSKSSLISSSLGV